MRETTTDNEDAKEVEVFPGVISSAVTFFDHPLPPPRCLHLEQRRALWRRKILRRPTGWPGMRFSTSCPRCASAVRRSCFQCR